MTRSLEPTLWSDAVIEATLSYAGPEEGELQVWASPAFGARLAANMLGVEVDDAEVLNHSRDAVGEMLNVVAGSLVARVFGTDVLCHLGVPRVALVPASEPSRSTCVVGLLTDDGERMDFRVLTPDR